MINKMMHGTTIPKLAFKGFVDHKYPNESGAMNTESK
jgi:hypothetical protein